MGQHRPLSRPRPTALSSRRGARGGSFSRRICQYASGTEYEFERAREGYEQKSSPEILCYLKTAEVSLSMKDRALRARQVAELDAVSAFVDKWFRSADGTFKSAFYNFEKTAQFE